MDQELTIRIYVAARTIAALPFGQQTERIMSLANFMCWPASKLANAVLTIRQTETSDDLRVPETHESFSHLDSETAQYVRALDDEIEEPKGVIKDGSLSGIGREVDKAIADGNAEYVARLRDRLGSSEPINIGETFRNSLFCKCAQWLQHSKYSELNDANRRIYNEWRAYKFGIGRSFLLRSQHGHSTSGHPTPDNDLDWDDDWRPRFLRDRQAIIYHLPAIDRRWGNELSLAILDNAFAFDKLDVKLVEEDDVLIESGKKEKEPLTDARLHSFHRGNWRQAFSERVRR